MSENQLNEPGNLVMGKYSTIERKVSEGGATHVYGVDPETGKKKHLSHEDILNAYGHTSQERTDYNAQYEQSVLEAEDEAYEDDLDAQAELDEEWAELQQTFFEARQSGDILAMVKALEAYKAFVDQFQDMGELERKAMLAELLNKEPDTDRDDSSDGTSEDDGGALGVNEPTTQEQEYNKSTIDKIKEAPTRLYLAVTTKLGEMSKSWKELPEKKKKQYKLIGGIATAAVAVAGAYLLMRGFSDGSSIDQSTTSELPASGLDGSPSAIETTPSPDVTPSDTVTPESSGPSAETTTDPSIVQESAQTTPEPSASVDTTPTTQPSPEASTTADVPDTATSGGPDASTGNDSESADPGVGAETASTTNLTSAQEKFVESDGRYPWQHAANAYGVDRATEVLEEAVKNAQAAGLDVDTFGEGEEWMIRANGSWETKDVVEVLAEYMPRQ